MLLDLKTTTLGWITKTRCSDTVYGKKKIVSDQLWRKHKLHSLSFRRHDDQIRKYDDTVKVCPCFGKLKNIQRVNMD